LTGSHLEEAVEGRKLAYTVPFTSTTTTIIITVATIITTTGYKNDNMLSDNSWFGMAARKV